MGTCSTGGWVGNRSDSGNVFSVRARLRDRPINLCLDPGNTDNDSAGAIWVMVAGWNPGEYAQVGYARIAGMANPQVFTEYSYDLISPPVRTFFPGIWNGVAQGTHTSIVDYSDVTERLYFSVDGSSKGSTPWSPDVQWAAPWEGQFYAETWDRGDDVPGTAGARTDWTLIAVQKAENGGWVNADGDPLTSDLAVYKANWSVHPTSFQTYTQR